MATYYVNSAATGGTNTGASWANAFLSFWSLPALLSADIVYVASTHDEAGGGGGSKTLVLPLSGECAYIFSVTAGTTTAAPGALIRTTAVTGHLTFDGSMYVSGLVFEPLSATTLAFISDSNESGILNGCTFRNAPAGQVTFSGVSLVGCTIDLVRDTAGASRAITALGSSGTTQQVIGLRIINAANRTGNAATIVTSVTSPTAGPGIVSFIGCDFSAVPSACEIFEGGATSLSMEFVNCLFPATYTLLRAAATARYRLAMYNTGADNAGTRNSAVVVAQYQGTWSTDFSVYLNSADGAVSNNGSGVDVRYSWFFSDLSALNNRGQPLITDWIYAYVQPGTYSVSLFTNAIPALTTTTGYMEVDYMASATNQKYTAAITPDAGVPGGAEYPVDGAGGAWVGPGGFSQIITLPGLVVAQAGLIRARLFTAAPQTTLYLNPKLYIV